MSPVRLPVLSFRTRILLLVLGVAVAPLALTGFWLTGSTARSGEALLRSRLGEQLERDRRTVGVRWIPYRSVLLDVADHPALPALLEGNGEMGMEPALRARLEAVVDGLPPEVVALRAATLDGRTVWRRERSVVASPLTFGTPFRARLDIRDRVSGEVLGVLEASLPLQALLPGAAGATPGMVVAAVDQPEGTLLTPPVFDPLLLEGPRFRWGGDEWLTASSELREPHVRLFAAAPLAPFVAPFRDAARRGGLLLFATAALGLGAAVVLTGRMTRSLQELVRAAESVTAGELEPTLDVGGEDEIGRVSRAFNEMTRSLGRTLARLADREALAAVGEFAATLAHEIRNPLTAIQLDLQQVEERLRPGSQERELQQKALDHVRRLNRTVTGALETARSGRGGAAGGIDVREPVVRALETARGVLGTDGALLGPLPGGAGGRVEGDPEALERAFLNVILNAGQAAGAGGEVGVGIEREGDAVVVIVEDDGPGIPPDIADRVFEPMVTRREGGTGLGLPVTRRVVEAHGGTVALEARAGGGTAVRIRLPLAKAPEAERRGGTDRSGPAGSTVTDRSGARGAASGPGAGKGL